MLIWTRRSVCTYFFIHILLTSYIPKSQPNQNSKNIPMSLPTPSLKAITLTHVRYPPSDHLAHFLAWISLIPIFISLPGFLSHFIFRRDIHGLFFAAGLLISQVLNDIIKNSIQQSRPETCVALETCDSHGWPSSHCQYMFFFAVYLSLLVKGRGKAVWVSVVWTLAWLTMWSRVYLGYHTVAQVCAGAVLGFVLGGIWFWIVNSMLVGYFPLIEESAIGRYLYMKDTTHIPNVLKFEYDNARAARKKFPTD